MALELLQIHQHSSATSQSNNSLLKEATVMPMYGSSAHSTLADSGHQEFRGGHYDLMYAHNGVLDGILKCRLFAIRWTDSVWYYRLCSHLHTCAYRLCKPRFTRSSGHSLKNRHFASFQSSIWNTIGLTRFMTRCPYCEHASYASMMQLTAANLCGSGAGRVRLRPEICTGKACGDAGFTG